MLLQFVGSLEVGQKELRRLGVAGHIEVVRREILVLRISKSDTIKGGILNKEGEVVFGLRKREMAVCHCTKSAGALFGRVKKMQCLVIFFKIFIPFKLIF